MQARLGCISGINCFHSYDVLWFQILIDDLDFWKQ